MREPVERQRLPREQRRPEVEVAVGDEDHRVVTPLRPDAEDQIAQRARAEESLRQRVQELWGLQALGQLVSFAHPLDQIVLVYLQRLLAYGRIETAELYLLKEQVLWRAGAESAGGDGAFLGADLSECSAQLAMQEARAMVDAINADGDIRTTFQIQSAAIDSGSSSSGRAIPTPSGSRPGWASQDSQG